MLSERFDVFVILPVAIVIGMLLGMTIAGLPIPIAAATNSITVFCGIYLGLVIVDLFIGILRDVSIDIVKTISGTSNEPDEAGEPGEIIVPLVRDEYVFGVVKLFNPIPSEQRKRPYEEKRLSRVIAGWIKTLQDRNGSKE